MPAKAPESPLEIAYNSAVQSFVRRDHVGTQASLGRLLRLTEELPHVKCKWYQPAHSAKGEVEEGQIWRFRVLKLLISANASLYSDPPHRVEGLPPHVARCLPPAPPNLILKHAIDVCNATLGDPGSTSHDVVLPPQIISTFVLAALKLQPAAPALAFARATIESWLAGLPEGWQGGVNDTARIGRESPVIENYRERNRESYLKVVELFVGEVLAREGEFEMARAFLEGDQLLESKRKEALFRQIRSMEARARASYSANDDLPPPQSPSASLVLPTPADTRSRRSSTSSSSSERTARPRPAVVGGVSSQFPSRSRSTLLGEKTAAKAEVRAGEPDGDARSTQTDSTMPLPKQIHVNPSTHSTLRRTASSGVQRNLRTILDLVPASIKHRLSSPHFLLSHILPLPLLLLGMLAWSRRGRRQDGPPAVAGLAVAGDIRQRLQDVTRRNGQRGLRAWVVYWIKWWLAKIVGVWRMGTTLTYL